MRCPGKIRVESKSKSVSYNDGKGEKTLSQSCVVNSVLVARQGISEWSASSCGDWGDWEIEVEHRTLIPTPRHSQ